MYRIPAKLSVHVVFFINLFLPLKKLPLAISIVAVSIILFNASTGVRSRPDSKFLAAVAI